MEKKPQPFRDYLRSYFKNIGQMLKHPLALLPTILITGVWILLGFLKKGMKESAIMASLNFLTFAQGGIYGGVVGAIGGIIGKILVATLVNCLVLPLFVRGAKPMDRFKSGFKSFGRSFAFSSAGALSSFVGGLAVALFIYSFLNITQRWQEGLVGIAAAVLLIRSIGQKSGFVLSFLLGFVKQRTGKSTPSKEGIIRFLSGMALGFTVGTGLSIIGLRWAILVSLIAGALAFLLFLLAKSQRTAATMTCIALLAFIPLRADNPAPQNNQDLNKKVYEQYSKQIDPMVSDINRLRTELQEAQASGDDKRADRLDAELQNAVGHYSEFMTEKRAELESGGGSGKKDQSNEIPPTAREYDDDDFGSGTGSGTQNSDIERLASNLVEVARRLYGLGDEDEFGEKGGKTRDNSKEKEDREPNYALEDFFYHAGQAPTHGWTDEWDHTHDKGAIGLMDGIAGIGAATAAAGAAAGAAGGAGGAGGADWPDFPDSEGLDWDMDTEEKEEEDDNYYYDGEEEETEGGDGDGEEEYAEEAEESEEEEEEEEYEEEAEEEEKSEEEEETEEEEEEESEEEAEEETEEESEEYEEEEPEQTEEEEEQPEEEPAEEGEESAPEEAGEQEQEQEEGLEQAGQEEEQVAEEEEEDDYDYEAERLQREKEQEEINKRYASDHQKDWEKFSTTSDQERITKEAEEAMRQEEELEKYRQIAREEEQRQENVKHYAEKYGIATTDKEGNERNIWDIEHDTKRASLANKNKGLYQDALDTQQICNEVELECSEKIAELELVDKVADGTVNVMAEYVPGGKKVKDARDLLKAPLVGMAEAHAEGRSVLRGGAGGLAEGVITVAQNHLEDVSDSNGLKGPVKDVFEGTMNVYFEGGKKVLNDVISGKHDQDPDKTWENAQNAMVKKTLEIGVGKATGGNNIATEFIMKGHDELKFGSGDDAKTLSDGITDTINNAKNETLAYGMYLTGTY